MRNGRPVWSARSAACLADPNRTKPGRALPALSAPPDVPPTAHRAKVRLMRRAEANGLVFGGNLRWMAELSLAPSKLFSLFSSKPRHLVSFQIGSIHIVSLRFGSHRIVSDRIASLRIMSLRVASTRIGSD